MATVTPPFGSMVTPARFPGYIRGRVPFLCAGDTASIPNPRNLWRASSFPPDFLHIRDQPTSARLLANPRPAASALFCKFVTSHLSPFFANS